MRPSGRIEDRPGISLTNADVEKITETWFVQLKVASPHVSHRDKILIRYLLHSMDHYGNVVATLDNMRDQLGLPMQRMSRTLAALERLNLIHRRRGIIIVNTYEIPYPSPSAERETLFSRWGS